MDGWSGGRAEGRRALANTERDDVTYPETGYNSGRLLGWIGEESCMGVACNASSEDELERARTKKDT